MGTMVVLPCSEGPQPKALVQSFAVTDSAAHPNTAWRMPQSSGWYALGGHSRTLIDDNIDDNST